MNEKKETGVSKTNPTLPQLYADQESALLMPRDTAMKFLNVDPPEPWIKTHPYIKGYRYLPIDKVEFLLKVIFREYKIEVIDYRMVLNATTVQVRVHYKDLTTGDWMFHDGVGAIEPQTAAKSGSLKLDASNINPGAIAMALPIAKSVAVKDACDHLGTVFGSNLNRKDTLKFAETAVSVTDSRLKALIDHATTVEELEKLREHLTQETSTYFEEKWNLLSGVVQ
jgi:hypothetical protein